MRILFTCIWLLWSSVFITRGYGYMSNKIGLLKYKKMNYNILVTWNFIAPDRDIAWPRGIWSMKLGSTMKDIRSGDSRTNKTEDVESIRKQAVKGYNLTRAALLNYKKLNGHMLVPTKFVVPYDDVTWPVQTWGKKLGKAVRDIRSGDSNKDKREDLEIIGFNFNLQRVSYGYESTRAALLNYKKLNGHMLVPTKFVVPDGDVTWPEQTWGQKLGKAVRDIRSGANFNDKREDLEIIGFDFNPQKVSYGYESTRAVLLNYKKLNGHMLVPTKFVVPDGDVTWPEQAWGMKLGRAVVSIRSGDSYKDKREELDSIGFEFNLKSVKHESTRAALLNYKKLNGDMLVPIKFVVPNGDIAWPEQTWGMKLGSTVNNIRSGGSHKDMRADLKSIGLKFNLQKVNFGYDSTRATLLNYEKLNGHMLVPNRFVVPYKNVEWPEETWGMKLGSAVTRMRRGVTHKDEREDLESIGFNFNPQRVSYEYESTKAAKL